MALNTTVKKPVNSCVATNTDGKITCYRSSFGGYNTESLPNKTISQKKDEVMCDTTPEINIPKIQSECPKDFVFTNDSLTDTDYALNNTSYINGCIKTENNVIKCLTNKQFGSTKLQFSSVNLGDENNKVKYNLDNIKKVSKAKVNCSSYKSLSKEPMSQTDCPLGTTFQSKLIPKYTFVNNVSKVSLENTCALIDSENYVSCYSKSEQYSANPSEHKFNYNYLYEDPMFKKDATIDGMRKANETNFNLFTTTTYDVAPKSFLKFRDYNTYMKTMPIKL